MASLSASHLRRIPSISLSSSFNRSSCPSRAILLTPFSNYCLYLPLPSPPPPSSSVSGFNSISLSYSSRFSSGSGNYADDEEDGHHTTAAPGFREAVALFNGGDYYKCHDILESIWYQAQDPSRTLIHGILQCAVGFHHLFNQNHRGAMMELGEGLCKLRKMNFESGPFLRFEQEISAVLDFIYQTQLELAACTDDFCLALDQSERSYQLLGGYAAGQHLYCLESDPSEIRYIVFRPDRSYEAGEPPRVKLPTLHASAEDLKEIEYDGVN